MDYSNRIPLLNIIKNEFIAEGYQIFISTYDRQWYELSKNWFQVNGCNFKHVETFIHNDDAPNNYDQPIVIDKDLSHFEKAKKYFEAKGLSGGGKLFEESL